MVLFKLLAKIEAGPEPSWYLMAGQSLRLRRMEVLAWLDLVRLSSTHLLPMGWRGMGKYRPNRWEPTGR
jgi:hypothetical protein